MSTDAQLGDLMGSLPPDSLVRTWAWQGTMATNVRTGTRDWTGLDRVLAAATAHHQHLIFSLSDQAGTCDDGHWKDSAWYGADGFRSVFHQERNARVLDSYWDWMHEIVQRYASSPAVAMWEPINEPEGSDCPGQVFGPDCGGHQVCPSQDAAAAALRHFYDVVGEEIQRLDPQHPVESGTIGGGQCGTSWTNYVLLGSSPGIDVLSYHDYSNAVMPGDQWNGLELHIRQAAALNKPLIVGESGMLAANSAGCTSDTERAASLTAKIRGQLAAGVAAVLPWDWVPSLAGGCSYDVGPGDPLVASVVAAGMTSNPA